MSPPPTAQQQSEAAGPGQASTPEATVVLCTYNRAERIEGTVRAILDQQGCDFELVVVDDGSTDATPDVLAAIADDRLRVVRRPNGGLSAARNTGLDAASGRWVIFADDDDIPEPGWLQALLAPAADQRVGVTCCGGTFIDRHGVEFGSFLPRPLGEPFGSAVGAWLAGTFAARSDLVRRAGGYLTGLGVSHQTELFIRLLATAREEGLETRSVDVRALRIERRPITDRPLTNSRLSYDGTRWVLARHAATFAGHRLPLARYEGIVGTAAARLGDWRSARRHLFRSARHVPRSPVRWGRLALAAVPVAGERVWNRHGVWASHDPAEIGLLRQTRDHGHVASRELFLPWRYRENPPVTSDEAKSSRSPTTTAADFPVRRMAHRLVGRRGWSSVVDAWGDQGIEAVDPTAPPRLIVCADVVQRVDDPVHLLHRLAGMADGGPVLVSTRDRAISDPDRPLGPPTNPRHRREWTHDEFELLLHSTGFDVERRWRLPRRPAPHGRSSMVFLVRERGSAR